MNELRDLKAAPPRPRHLALVGNPNVGKSSLFNALTGLRQKVANYPGVTVDAKIGEISLSDGRVWQVTDLPGISSLVARSPDEQIAVDALLGRIPTASPVDQVLVVIDAARPRRGFFLLSQVLELGLPTSICLNMSDEASLAGIEFDPAALRRLLGGVPVVATSAARGDGIDGLRASLLDAKAGAGICVSIPGLQGISAPSVARWVELRAAVGEAELAEQEAEARWAWVTQILTGCSRCGTPARATARERLDRYLLHPLLGPAAFVLVMGTLFQAVFRLADAPVEWIELAVARLGELATTVAGEGVFGRLLSEGIIGGVGSVLVFLPQILILFFFIGLLEDSGYMTRAAFLVDRPLRAIGLSGQSFIPLLSSFACAVPGILATRTIEDRRERTIATMVAPLMTCSARLPVYSILISTFIPERTVGWGIGIRGLLMLGLYGLGLLLSLIAAWVLNRFLSRSQALATVLELPPYRFPTWRAVGLQLWHRARQFLQRAGTVILALSALVWAMTNLPVLENAADSAAGRAAQIEQSWAGRLGHTIEPAIAPLGFDWRIGIGLCASLAAREVFVSTMAVVHATETGAEEDEATVGAAMRASVRRGGEPLYDLPTVLALLAFFAVALQCISTVAVVVRETRSWAQAALQFGGLSALAYLLAWVVHTLAS